MSRKYLRGEIYYADLDPVVGSEQMGTRPVLTRSWEKRPGIMAMWCIVWTLR